MVLNFISCLLIIKSWLLHPGSSSFPYAVIVVRSTQIPTGLRRFIKSLLASRCVLTGYHHTIHHITGGIDTFTYRFTNAGHEGTPIRLLYYLQQRQRDQSRSIIRSTRSIAIASMSPLGDTKASAIFRATRWPIGHQNALLDEVGASDRGSN